EFRIIALQKPSQPKRPIEDSNLPMRTPNNAKPIRNANGNTNVQITFIVDEYKRTLDVDDKKKFNRIKTDHVKKLIKDAHVTSKAGKTLLDILYYSWVIGKDDAFLLTKYTQTKIEETKSLIKNINDYLWLISTKKIKGTKCKRLEKDPKYKNPAQYPVLFGPGGQFSFNNPLGFPIEIIDDEENIKQIINQYQLSLKNQSGILIDNLKRMQNALINGIKVYNNNNDKKEYLHKIFKILVTQELDDVEDDDDINNIFDSLNF
ncbi:16399_t:CDS:1, partial [Gigaspora margarita]